MKLRYKFFFALGILLSALTIKAQSSKLQTDPDAAFKMAIGAVQNNQENIAYPIMERVSERYALGIAANSAFPALQAQIADYYAIVSKLQTNSPEGVVLAEAYIDLEKNLGKIQMMRFHLAQYFFRQKKFQDANRLYAKAGFSNLNNAQIASLKFNQAYGYFIQQQFNIAKPLFQSISQLSTDPNYIPANYYFGFIAFFENQYRQALESFSIAEKSLQYQNIVPFYIAEIYYFLNQKDKALSAALAALKNPNQYYTSDLHQLVGHIYYEQGNFKDALPYLAYYALHTEKINKEQLYELSYCYYATQQWSEAAKGFKKLGGKEDALAQNAMYLLADCYLKMGEKNNARSAFLFCLLNNANPLQQEVSLLNYAKLSYELNYYDIAGKNLKTFIEKYPNSTYILEAKELQINVLANTSNYSEAILLINAMPQKTESIQKILPKVLYGKAVELINDNELDQANELLTELINLSKNQKELQLAYFWKGEIAYRQGKAKTALDYFLQYLKNPVLSGNANPNIANYNAGYCEMKLENYAAALSFFKKYYAAQNNEKLAEDAAIRMADCYFMLKKMEDAKQLYQRQVSTKTAQADYALYQLAMIEGALGKNNQKIALLQNLIQNYPPSNWTTKANVEIATAYMAQEQWQQALSYLSNILQDKKSEKYRPLASLNLGISYYNLNEKNKALDYFKTTVKTYPNAPQSEEALEYIKRIHIENQTTTDYINWMSSVGKSVSVAERDSLLFAAALLAFDAKNYTSAAVDFKNYINNNPNGKHWIEANYFLAEINLVQKQTTEALNYYQIVALANPNKYAERSALQAARIYYFNLQNYPEAEKMYDLVLKLSSVKEYQQEAKSGKLKALYKTEKWKEGYATALDIAQQATQANTDELNIAYMVIAKKNQYEGLYPAALEYYQSILKLGKSVYSAEAQYKIAEIYFLTKQLNDAEKTAFVVIKNYGSYEYWVTKSYLLLGDIYAYQKDWFNAEATYRSIAENATILSLQNEAKEKLATVLTEKTK